MVGPAWFPIIALLLFLLTGKMWTLPAAYKAPSVCAQLHRVQPGTHSTGAVGVLVRQAIERGRAPTQNEMDRALQVDRECQTLERR